MSNLFYLNYDGDTLEGVDKGFPGYSDYEIYDEDFAKIPEIVTTIGEGAFKFCWSLQNICIPKNIIVIGNYAFTSCYDLESVEILENVKLIGKNVFQGCHSLKSINVL